MLVRLPEFGRQEVLISDVYAIDPTRDYRHWRLGLSTVTLHTYLEVHFSSLSADGPHTIFRIIDYAAQCHGPAGATRARPRSSELRVSR